MWLLLLPPLIVIASFTFLLWYLTKKQYDPVVQAEMFRMHTMESVPMINIKAIFWSFLEKMMRRFKLIFLQLHNRLNEWSHSAKRQKERNKQELQQLEEQQSVLSSSEPELVPERTIPRTDISRAPAPSETFLEKPIARMTHTESHSTEDAVAIEVKKTALDDVKKTAPGHEEDYIVAIANNPKDHTAYEKLGDYYMDNGNIKDAKECYRQVLRLSPSHTEVKMKIRRLEKMLG